VRDVERTLLSIRVSVVVSVFRRSLSLSSVWSVVDGVSLSLLLVALLLQLRYRSYPQPTRSRRVGFLIGRSLTEKFLVARVV